ncbi:putative ubiquinone biosynthesis monooxygenase [Coemansia sp. RSA 1287]|nr:putative ubiquinone biosynthesis monooxygenase [Coemansia sp. RSA 1287]
MTAQRFALRLLAGYRPPAVQRMALATQNATTQRRALATQNVTSQTTADSGELYDVVIIGGGPAGCALAAALGSLDSLSRKRVALVDPGKLSEMRQWTPPADAYLPRTLQITSSNKRYLDNLGLWQWCFEDRVQAYNRAVVTDALGGGAVDLAAMTLHGRNDTAFMVETKNLVSGLLKALDHSSSCVDVVERARVTEIEATPSMWPVVTLSNSRRLQARLIVGADGASSRVRKYAGIGTYGTEYAQYGLVATLCLEQLNSSAFQRFLPSGPIALLPFPGGFANLVWSLDSELVQLLKTAPEAIFGDLINAAFRLTPAEMGYIYSLLRSGVDPDIIGAEVAWRLDVFARNNSDTNIKLPPRVAALSPRSRTSFPLRMRMVDSLVANRVALIGDAGHVMHPLAGQGLNMGLADVQCLAQVLEQAAAAGEDLGSAAVLDRYNSQRYVRNLAMQGIVDKVWHVFGAHSGTVATLRSLAMNGLDRLPAIKSRMIHAFMQ